MESTEFSFYGNNPNRIPDLSFESKAASVLKQTAKDALNTGLTIGAFSISQLRNKMNGDKPAEYSLDKSYYTQNNNRSYLAGSERIVSLTFLPTPYINQFGQRTETPRLDIEICAVGVGVQKTVVKTELINQEGTIKEVVSAPDYSVSVSGLLIGYFARPTAQNPLAAKPLEDMKKLLQIAKAKISVKVTSDTLAIYGITRLSIEALNMPQDLKDINIQPFALTAYSDSDDLSIL